jgi:hypothetical protein
MLMEDAMTIVDLYAERRNKRSPQAHTAITYQLEHIFEAQNLNNFVLGDSRGLVLAAAGDDDAATILAAYAPMMAAYRGNSRRMVFEKMESMVPGFRADSLSIRTFDVDGETLYLCSVGRKNVARQASLYRAVTGIRRILDQTAAAA